MASTMSQLRWPPVPTALSLGAAALEQPKKDPWMSTQSPPASTPVKRFKNSPWDEMGLAQPLFGMVTSTGNDIWANDSSPLYGSLSPAASVVSNSDSPKFTASPKQFSSPNISVFGKAIQNLQSHSHESIIDARDDPYPIKHKSLSSLPFADRSVKVFPEPGILSLCSSIPSSSIPRTRSSSPNSNGLRKRVVNELKIDTSQPVINDLWSTDQGDGSSCDDSFFCVDSEEQLLKTELCRNWGPPLFHCQYGDTCNFAHGEAELRERIRRGEYKSKLCDEPVRLGVRSCTYTTQQQSRCNYCHPGEAVRRKCSRPYFDSEYFSILAKEFPGNNYPFGIFL